MWAAVEFGLRGHVKKRLVSWLNNGRKPPAKVTWYDKKHEKRKAHRQLIHSTVYESIYELVKTLLFGRKYQDEKEDMSSKPGETISAQARDKSRVTDSTDKSNHTKSEQKAEATNVSQNSKVPVAAEAATHAKADGSPPDAEANTDHIDVVVESKSWIESIAGLFSPERTTPVDEETGPVAAGATAAANATFAPPVPHVAVVSNPTSTMDKVGGETQAG